MVGVRQAVAVVDDLAAQFPRIPEVDPGQLPVAVQQYVGAPAFGSDRAGQSHLVSAEVECAGSAGIGLDLGVVSGNHDLLTARVPHRYEEVAGGKRLAAVAGAAG